ncbi:MAG: hypothetical protein WAP23_03760 [Candidatus Spechtbacterales bacterium]
MNKLHELLRMKDDAVLVDLDKKMSAISGKRGVIKEIEEENDWRIEKTLKRLGVNAESPDSREVYEALLDHLRKSERRLHVFLNGGDGDEFTNFSELLERGNELMKPGTLWVLKKEKFREILEKNPPPNILQKFGYKSGQELFSKEKLEEIASSLRFMETREWMHKTFDEAYSSLTPNDFEEREAESLVLSGKWLEAARPFVEKKRHNLSHLKELGLIFIIPIEIKQPGELMRVFSLYLHYLYEVQFYSKLFRGINNGGNFSKGLISLLRGDILDTAPTAADDKSFNWLIVQRYLAKDDDREKRLFVPHVNPEAIHWKKAEEALAKLDKQDLSLTFESWIDLDWVGGYFDGGKDELISFDLIDTVMSLVKEKNMLKYMYHQQEALWNRIFTGYMGDGDKLEKLITENLLKGYIAVS